MDLSGHNLVAGEWVAGGELGFRAVNPATGAFLEPLYAAAGSQEVDAACAAAAQAFDPFRALGLERRGAFLEAVATELEALGDSLIVRAMAETGLPRARLEGERGRTSSQLRLFADVVRQGDFLGARTDRALPDRQPLPRPSLGQVMIPLGPVAVFGASNFPLAFSVAGGDTASAFAAGCPVVVKGHPAHPGTGELVAQAILKAVVGADLPRGVFSLLNGPSHALGEALAADPRIKAVGFTGSRAGGLALSRLAAARAEPIPVYAEMSSINPVVLLPAALESRGPALGKAFINSLTLGAGQFCTNPGLILAVDGAPFDRFLEAAGAELAAAQPAVMLTPGIHRAYQAGLDSFEGHGLVRRHSCALPAEGPNQGSGALFETTAGAFLADPSLSHEVFGAASLVVRCPDLDALAAVLEAMEGQLTATLQMDDDDLPLARQLLPILERKVGRILANGWPTGVEVSHAMVHGGPFPATSDSRTTSVGTLAIARFLRPVCYQNLPDTLLPRALQEANPDHVNRRVDGQFTLAAAR